MNNKVVPVVIVVVLIIGGFLVFKNRSVAPTEGEVNNTMPVLGEEGEGVEEMVVEESLVKEFMVDAAPYSFSPKTMSVNVGDTVKITLKNVNGVHDLKIDEFNASTRVLNAGEMETITFVALKAGTFQYYCSVGNHRAMGMVGTLTVR